MTRVVIQGFGFMGKLHARCYAANDSAEIAGIVDIDPDAACAAAHEMELGEIPVSESLESILAQTGADAADLCLPTDAHPEAAETAFAAGLHVFCEKPIALDTPSAERMTLAAERAGKQLMVGHCIRFWPEYEILKAMVDSGEAGPLLALNCERRATRPDYTKGDWISDPERCAGAALDFHIHDADFIRYLLGDPESVFARGIRLPSGWDHMQASYGYDGAAVAAEGGWNYPANWGFRMGFHALFENGSLDFDSAGDPGLRKIVDGRVYTPQPERDRGPLAGFEAYRRELDYFVACLESGKPVAQCTGADATRSLRLVLAEIESASTGEPVRLS